VSTESRPSGNPGLATPLGGGEDPKIQESSVEPGDPQAQLIVFTMAGCAFGIAIRQVREILRVGNITRMPKAPYFLEGIIHLRGHITPVLDPKKRLGLPLTDRTEDSRILVVEWKDLMMGLVVDRVSETLKVHRSELKAVSPGVGMSVDPVFLSGLWEGPAREVLLLSIEHLIRLEEPNREPDPRSGPQEE
jgi:purine-binding chemotaxis protein CheW